MNRRTLLSCLTVFALIPALVIFGGKLGGRTYYLVGVAVIFLTMMPFFLLFEQRRPQAREVVTLAVLCALAVASRAVFAALPHFKPVLAIIMAAGFAFGPESGFLVGAMTAFASNFIFGQGPWTPWQMFAYGMGGFLAGVAERRKLLPKSKWAVGAFGFGVVLCVVGPILDTSSVFTLPVQVTWKTAGAIYLAGLPANALQAAATFVTLAALNGPMLEKLNRLKQKYGMLGSDKFW